MHALGWTQANIVADLKQMGLLLESGALAPDRLRENPCDRTEVSTVHAAGQRGLTTTVEGSLVHTAHFCQAVNPSVTIIGLDGTSAAATPGQLAAFGALFRSSNAAGNCPTPGGSTRDDRPAGRRGHRRDRLRPEGLDPRRSGAAGRPAVGADLGDGGAPGRRGDGAGRLPQADRQAEFGSTAYPLPNCPGADASRGLYAEGTKVTVTAGLSSGHVLVGWHETGSSFNPTLAVMDQPRTLTANFRAKTTGEVIMESVVDPALDAAGIAAKKAVGGIAYTIKVVGEQLIDGALLGTLSSLGTALQQGFAAIGVQGVVLDHIALTLQIPQNAFRPASRLRLRAGVGRGGRRCPRWRPEDDGDGCREGRGQGAGGRRRGRRRARRGAAAGAKMAAGDPAVLAQAYITARAAARPSWSCTSPWTSPRTRRLEERATAAAEGAGAYALDLLAEEFGTGFTWESSATEAWTTGGDAFLNCMAKNGRAIAGA
jgi:hypothetical protein